MNTVLLVVPLVAFVIVVLLGFTGCSLNTRGKPGPPPEPPPVPQDYDDEVKQSNPIAYWRLSDADGSNAAKDEIGAPPLGDHPGTYQGIVTLGQPPGLNDSDVSATPARFDGSSFADVAHAPAFEMATFTVEALVHPDSVGTGAAIVRNMSSDGGWSLGIVPPTGTDNPAIDVVFEALVGDESGVGGPLFEFELAKLGTAWHVAMTYDGTELTLYLDGAQVNHIAMSYAPNMVEPLRIGENFEGAIQEVAVYDTALTAAEISTHFIANKPPDVGP
jgi:hypothetical protein